jgi:hypothetical protein
LILVKPARIVASPGRPAQHRLGAAIVIFVGCLAEGCSTFDRPVPVSGSQVITTPQESRTIRAQDGDTPESPNATGSVGSVSTALPEGLQGASPEGSPVAATGGAAESPAAGAAAPRVVTGPLDTVLESLFGEASTSDWTPLYFSELLNTGWDQPFVFSPPSDSGALRQEWLNAANGVFYRQWTLDYNYRQIVLPSGNADFGTWAIFAPLSRRLELYVTVPFVDYQRVANPTPLGGPGTPIARSGGASSDLSYKATFGDITITPQVMLQETKNTSIMSSLTIRTPTGSIAAGNGATSLEPLIQFWQGLPNRWVVRGSVGPTIPLSDTGLRTTLNTNLTVGRFLTLDEVRYFKQFTVYFAVNNAASTDNRGPAADTLTVLPGIRFLLVENTWFLYGVEIPLVAPRDEHFGMFFTLVRRW